MSAPGTARTAPGWPAIVAIVIAIAILAVVLAWLATIIFGGGGGDRGANLSEAVTQSLVDRGRYLAQVGDCAACHTAPNGKPFAGGLPIASPIGTIFATNITPDRKTGIGRYTLGDFERALRRGVRPDGVTLYPAMPYPSFAHVSDNDVRALYAYFLYDVKPVRQRNPRNLISWPFSMRWPLTWWRWFFAPRVPGHATSPGAEHGVARGQYLVEGLGHCGSCHTPRALTLQEAALRAKDGKSFLSGGQVIDGWVVPSLRGEARTGLGSWTATEIATYLKSGRTDRSASLGGMSQVVHESTQHMDDSDLWAVADFLKTLGPARDEPAFKADPATAKALQAGDVSKEGSALYIDNCAACHRSTGEGYTQVFPALADNPVVNNPNPASLIRVILSGSTMPATKAAPTTFAMPAFSHRLSDADVAKIATFVRSSWGNSAPPVGASDVRNVRDSLTNVSASAARAPENSGADNR